MVIKFAHEYFINYKIKLWRDLSLFQDWTNFAEVKAFK